MQSRSSRRRLRHGKARGTKSKKVSIGSSQPAKQERASNTFTQLWKSRSEESNTNGSFRCYRLLGSIYESIAVQQLCLKGITPRYRKYELRDEKKNKAKTYELDLVAERGFSVTAIEVKSSKNYTTSSLDKIKKKYPQLKVKRMVFGIKNLKFESDIITLPLYMILFL